nr:hypothetical protein Iba_chr15cCG1140 [Ipomoea batatas]
MLCFQGNNTLNERKNNAGGPHDFVSCFLTIRREGIFLLLQPALHKFGTTSFSVSTEHPGITQASPRIGTTHSLASFAALLRRIELKIGTPLHSRPPKLQILNPSATPITPFTFIRALRLQRLNLFAA